MKEQVKEQRQPRQLPQGVGTPTQVIDPVVIRQNLIASGRIPSDVDLSTLGQLKIIDLVRLTSGQINLVYATNNENRPTYHHRIYTFSPCDDLLKTYRKFGTKARKAYFEIMRGESTLMDVGVIGFKVMGTILYTYVFLKYKDKKDCEVTITAVYQNDESDMFMKLSEHIPFDLKIIDLNKR